MIKRVLCGKVHFLSTEGLCLALHRYKKLVFGLRWRLVRELWQRSLWTGDLNKINCIISCASIYL